MVLRLLSLTSKSFHYTSTSKLICSFHTDKYGHSGLTIFSPITLLISSFPPLFDNEGGAQ